VTIRLRAHHLLCLLTYIGRGYTPAFTANYDAIAARLSQGEDIEIVAGPDDICAPLLAEATPHCLLPRIDERDRLAARDVSLLLARPLQAGTRIDLDAALLRQMREAFATGLTRGACTGCEWQGLCSRIAREGYAGTRVQAGVPLA